MPFIAVQGCKLVCGSGTTVSDPMIIEPPSTKVMIDNKPIYAGASFTVMISGYTGGTINVPLSGTGTATITPSMIMKVKSNNMGVLGMGDMSAPATITGQMNGPTGPVPTTFVDTVSVVDAGQTKVMAQ